MAPTNALVVLLASPVVAVDIVWNVQWPELCQEPAPPPDIISRFGIRTNSGNKFNGNVVATLYNHPGNYTIGDWPSILQNGTTINGGIPQLANLSRHLAAVESNVVSLFPDPEFSGLAIIDWEVWTPWFDFYPDAAPTARWTGYMNLSFAFAKGDKDLAIAQWNASSLEIMVRTLEVAKRLRPRAKWGYYGVIGCVGKFNVTAHACDAAMRSRMDALAPLWMASSALFPSIYAECAFNASRVPPRCNPADHTPEHIAITLGESLRQRRRLGISRTPIIAYTWYAVYSHQCDAVLGHCPLMRDPVDLDAEFLKPTREGVDGMIIWGSHGDVRPGTNDCTDFSMYWTSVLGPLLQTIAGPPTVIVEVGQHPVAAPTGEDYVGYTMDYWNATQGNNWGPTSSVLTFDVADRKLAHVASALGPSASFRIGGTSADRTDYDVPGGATRCSTDPMRNCLKMDRWLRVLQWAHAAGARVTFTLNGMAGRVGSTSAWDSRNAEEFLRYTRQRAPGGTLRALGLGNELTCNFSCPAFPNCPPIVEHETYAADVRVLRRLVDDIWAGAPPSHKPLIAVPDAGFATNLNMTLQLEYFDSFLALAGDVVDRVAYHMYVDGGNNPKLEADLTSPEYLDTWDPKFPAALREVARKRAPKAAAAGLWADEIAAAWGSCGGGSGGGAAVCDRFMDGYWYIHQLGTLAKLGHSMFARQTLRGGWYELINQTTSEPHPDFYIALMWKRFMGGGALNVSTVPPLGGDGDGDCAARLRGFASAAGTPPRASASTPQPEASGAAVALINFCQTSNLAITIRGPDSARPAHQRHQSSSPSLRHDYVFTPCSHDIHDNCIALGGKPLRLDSSGGIPPLVPATVDAGAPLLLPAGAFGWSVFDREA